MFLSATADVFIDLPATRKGADFSSMIDAVTKIVTQNRDFSGVESITSEISNLVMSKVRYATKCECILRADYFTKSFAGDKVSIGSYGLIGKTVTTRNTGEEDYIGVEVTGLNACPCTMDAERKKLISENPEYRDIINSIPVITHNQRNRVKIVVQKISGVEIEADMLIKVASDIIGSPVELGESLESDVALIYRQHKNPQFVEDVVRNIACSLKQKLQKLNIDPQILITSESEESVHRHNAFAEFAGKLSDIMC
jgi:GTP cyclohydrolase-4